MRAGGPERYVPPFRYTPAAHRAAGARSPSLSCDEPEPDRVWRRECLLGAAGVVSTAPKSAIFLVINTLGTRSRARGYEVVHV